MRISIYLFIALLSIGLAASTSVAQSKRPSGEDALRAADQQWLKVFAAKDLETSVGMCANDGSVLAPNAPIATGPTAIKTLFAGFFSLSEFKISWKPDRVKLARSRELGYTSGAYQLSFEDPQGKTVSDKGKYVTVWQKQKDGSWKVLLDIFNSDLPAIGAP